MAAYVVQITQANGPDTVTLDATSSPNVLNVTDGSTFASLTVNANTASPLIVDPDPTLSADLDLNGNDITGTGNITTTGDMTLTGDMVLSGDLTVNGTTTTLNTQTLDVEDKNITVAFGAVDAASADGAGLTVDGADATLTYESTGDNWALNKDLAVSGNIDLNGTKISLPNKEKSNLSNDGDLGFDSSQGLLLYRTQQGVSGDAVTVLDGANVAAGTGVGITNLGAGGTGTETFTFSIGQAVGTGDSPTFAGIDVTGTVESTVSSTGDFNFNAISSGGGNYRIYPDDATTANPTWLHQSNSSEDQAWVIGGVERMRLDASGNLGIANSNPSVPLDVTGNAAVSGKTKVGGGADGISTADELVLSKDQTNVGMSLLAADATGVVRIYLGSQTDTQAARLLHNETNDEMILQAAGALQLQSGGMNDRLLIDSSGNVGISNTSPSEALDVTGTGLFSGRVGVGTALGGNPSAADPDADNLVIDAGGADVGITLDSDPTAKGSIFFADGASGDNLKRGQIVYSHDGDYMAFATLASEAMRIDYLGNVGIQNSSPSVPLDVTGNAAVSSKVKIGTGVDGAGNGDELVLSKDQTNVGMSILATDDTGICRILFGSQSSTNAAKIQHSESNSRLFVQAEGDLYFQTGGSGTTMTLNGSGDLDVTGALSKGSGSFKIDHPLKPDTHHLVHSFIEGPQADNLYRGTVALVGGAATVNLDTAGRMTEGTFVALNGNVQCLTTNEQGWTAVRGSVSGNILTIEAQDAACTDTVSWMVIGERHDQHMIDTAWTDAQGRVITEPEKPPVEEEDTE